MDSRLRGNDKSVFNNQPKTPKGSKFRTGLVAFQFTLSAFLIIGTVVVNKQLHYIRTDIPFWIFPVTGILTLLVPLLTVSFQSVKAALSNPIKALRYE